MEYYSALKEKKKDEILLFAIDWMDLESIRLSETSQMEKHKNHDFTNMCDTDRKQ